MNMDKIRFGVEIIIVGAFWLLPFVFGGLWILSTGHSHWHHAMYGKYALDYVNLLPKEYLPYIAIGAIGLSYILGIMADLLTLHISKAIWPKIMEEVDDARFAKFLQNASVESASELNSRRGRNLVLRGVGFSFIINAPFVYGWLCRSLGNLIVSLTVLLVLFLFGFLFIWLFLKNRQKFCKFREAILNESKGKNNITSAPDQIAR